MTTEQIKSIISNGEGVTIEFKKSHNTLPRNLFETICAFLNRDGGNVLLGWRMMVLFLVWTKIAQRDW